MQSLHSRNDPVITQCTRREALETHSEASLYLSLSVCLCPSIRLSVSLSDYKSLSLSLSRSVSFYLSLSGCLPSSIRPLSSLPLSVCLCLPVVSVSIFTQTHVRVLKYTYVRITHHLHKLTSGAQLHASLLRTWNMRTDFFRVQFAQWTITQHVIWRPGRRSW